MGQAGPAPHAQSAREDGNTRARGRMATPERAGERQHPGAQRLIDVLIFPNAAAAPPPPPLSHHPPPPSPPPPPLEEERRRRLSHPHAAPSTLTPPPPPYRPHIPAILNSSSEHVFTALHNAPPRLAVASELSRDTLLRRGTPRVRPMEFSRKSRSDACVGAPSPRSAIPPSPWPPAPLVVGGSVYPDITWARSNNSNKQ